MASLVMDSSTWLDEVEIAYTTPRLIRGDNRGVITLAKIMKDYGKVKHIDICHHYLHELVQSESIIFEQITSADNLANLFTKLLAWDHHHCFLAVLNIY